MAIELLHHVPRRVRRQCAPDQSDTDHLSQRKQSDFQSGHAHCGASSCRFKRQSSGGRYRPRPEHATRPAIAFRARYGWRIPDAGSASRPCRWRSAAARRQRRCRRAVAISPDAAPDAPGCRPCRVSCPRPGTAISSGRSSHFGCGTAITAQLAMPGCAMAMFSRSIELIHSPPDLIRSLARSVMVRKPSRVDAGARRRCRTSPRRPAPRHWPRGC